MTRGFYAPFCLQKSPEKGSVENKKVWFFIGFRQLQQHNKPKV